MNENYMNSDGVKIKPCPFCGENLYEDETFPANFDKRTVFYKHPKNDCLFSECVVWGTQIDKWNMRKPMENIIDKLQNKALEHGIKGQHLEQCGWYTNACEEHGKRDGLYKAIEIIK